jgi:hypothetical protein
MNAPWKNLTGLSKVIAILATIAIIAFGLCSANLAFIVAKNPDSRWTSLPAFEGSIVLLCLAGMLVVGIIAIIRTVIQRFSSNSKEN